MAAVDSPSKASLLWYCLDYIDPRHLQKIYDLVMQTIWKGPPPKGEPPAIPLDEVDAEGNFHKPAEIFPLPTNDPTTPLPKTTYSIHLPPNLLTVDERLLQRVLGHSPKSPFTWPALQSLCLKDSSFLHSAIFSAQKKCSPLYDLIHGVYLHDYNEEPLSIQYEPAEIDVNEKDGTMWMDCVYKGAICTQSCKSIPFEAHCSYNLNNPVISCRSLFINPRREVE